MRPRYHAEVDAQLVRLGARQDLHDGEEAIEPIAADPALFIHQRLADHGDLRDRTAECEKAKAQELSEQARKADGWRFHGR